MWVAFFAVTIVAAISFALAAAWMSLQVPNVLLPHRKNRWSLMAEFAAGCRHLTRAACTTFEPRRPASGNTSFQTRNTSGAQLPRLETTVFRDVTLLPRRMRLLHIDSVGLARDEPLIFRQLALRCGECHATEQCARDLLDNSTDPFGENWRDYCPNASMLSTISTLRGIGCSLSIGENNADARR